VCCLWLCAITSDLLVNAFTTPASISQWQMYRVQDRNSPISTTTETSLYMSENDGNKPKYSRELYLREEAESPFRKVRFFTYVSVGLGALTSLAVSAARVAAALSGINADLLEQSAINVGVDLAGVIVVSLLYQRDLKAQESRLKRASKGAELAKLLVKLPKDEEDGAIFEKNKSDTYTTTLASLRRGRGIEKRVVIAVGGKEKIEKTLQEAARLRDSLEASDLLVVPIVVPEAVAPSFPETGDLAETDLPVALPVGNWKSLIDEESQEATSQGVDIAQDGFCIILKKNGRVGQRTKGIFLDRMVGEVEQRRDMGMDVKNI